MPENRGDMAPSDRVKLTILEVIAGGKHSYSQVVETVREHCMDSGEAASHVAVRQLIAEIVRDGLAGRGLALVGEAVPEARPVLAITADGRKEIERLKAQP